MAVALTRARHVAAEGKADPLHACEDGAISRDTPGDGDYGAARSPMGELQRARKLIAAAEAVRKFPFEGFSAAGVNGSAGVSRQAFDDHLAGREAALLAAFEQALALAGGRASAAFQAQEGWLDRVRAGLSALLGFFDEEPALARYCVVHSAQAGPAVLAARGEVLDALARVLDDERAPGGVTRRRLPRRLWSAGCSASLMGGCANGTRGCWLSSPTL